MRRQSRLRTDDSVVLGFQRLPASASASSSASAQGTITSKLIGGDELCSSEQNHSCVIHYVQPTEVIVANVAAALFLPAKAGPEEFFYGHTSFIQKDRISEYTLCTLEVGIYNYLTT